MPVRETNYKYRNDCLSPNDIAALQRLSKQVTGLYLMHTNVTWMWTWAMAPLQMAMAAMDSGFTTLGFDSPVEGKQSIYGQMCVLFLIATQQQTQLQYGIVHCMKEIQNIRTIMESDQPVPRITRRRHRTIGSLTENKAYKWTGFKQEQLPDLLKYLRMPEEVVTRSRYKYTGEEIMIMALTRIHTAESWMSLADGKFGGDARRSSELFQWFVDFLFETFYNAISGSSINMWVDHVASFRQAIWESFTELLLDKDGEPFRFDVAFEDWTIAFFIDCTAKFTCRPGGGGKFGDDTKYVNLLQKAFYTGYLKKHGLKFQTLWGPNGMFLSVFGSSIRENDNGMVNISGLNDYLYGAMPFIDEGRTCKAAGYGDAIYNDRSCIVGRAKKNSRDTWRKVTDKQFGRKRTSVENSYAGVLAYAALFGHERPFKLLNKGEEALKTTMVIFFLYNCYTCLNGNSTSLRFNIDPPTLGEYIPLSVDFARKQCQVVDQADLWDPEEDIPEDDED